MLQRPRWSDQTLNHKDISRIPKPPTAGWTDLKVNRLQGLHMCMQMSFSKWETAGNEGCVLGLTWPKSQRSGRVTAVSNPRTRWEMPDRMSDALSCWCQGAACLVKDKQCREKKKKHGLFENPSPDKWGLNIWYSRMISLGGHMGWDHVSKFSLLQCKNVTVQIVVAIKMSRLTCRNFSQIVSWGKNSAPLLWTVCVCVCVCNLNILSNFTLTLIKPHLKWLGPWDCFLLN